MKARLLVLIAETACILFPLGASPQGWSTTGTLAGFESGTTLSLGAYRSYASVFVHTARNRSTPVFLPGQEAALYAYLGRRVLSPRYLLLQGTWYPLATLSSFMETYHRQQFDRVEVADFNVLRSLGSGTEEPYALSLLLGNIVFLGYPERKDSSTTRIRPAGSSLAGLLVSAGQRHIHDNILVRDQWWQVELILTGTSRRTGEHRLHWNFRVGVKTHSTALAPDVVVLSLFRDHTSWQKKRPFLLANSRMQYEAHFPCGDQEQQMPFTVRQLLSYGKKIPLHVAGRTVFLRLGGGVVWEWVRRYDREACSFMATGAAQRVWLIQPSVEF